LAAGRNATSSISSTLTQTNSISAVGTIRRGGRPATYGLGWQATISDAMTDQEMITLARNWDSLCLFGWRPHM